MNLSNRAAVVGVGTTAYGKLTGHDEYSLAAWAFKEALADSGLDHSDIDGLATCKVPSYVRLGGMLGLNPRWTLGLPNNGRSSAIGIIEAAAAIATELATNIALIFATSAGSQHKNFGGDEVPDIWDPWGFTSPGASFALMFRRHAELYGTTSRQLAEVSVALRHHACLNPDAVMRKPITIDDHQASRLIVAPLRLLDYCIVNDGATCIIVTGRDRARDCARPPVYIAGVGGQDRLTDSSISLYSDDFFIPAMAASGERAYAMAGITRGDVNALMCYDNFSPAVLFALEGLGFCGKGEAGAYVEGGRLRLDGALPVNTDGGQLSGTYMQGWGLNIEAVRQVRGECGDRQITNHDVVQYVQGTPCSRSIIYTQGCGEAMHRGL